MDVKIRVVVNAAKNEVKKLSDGYKIYITAPAREGKANKALREVLADYFNVRKSQVSIVKGAKSKDKIVSIGI